MSTSLTTVLKRNLNVGWEAAESWLFRGLVRSFIWWMRKGLHAVVFTHRDHRTGFNKKQWHERLSQSHWPISLIRLTHDKRTSQSWHLPLGRLYKRLSSALSTAYCHLSDQPLSANRDITFKVNDPVSGRNLIFRGDDSSRDGERQFYVEKQPRHDDFPGNSESQRQAI